MLEVQNLVKEFKRRDGDIVKAVQGVSFDIHEGEIFSLLGPNGAGKTTTISMISGLISPTEGDASIGGHSITKEPLKAKALLGVIPQEIALYPTLTARQNLEFFGRMYDITGQELVKRVDEVLEFIDLVDRQNDRVETFSGGMKRRVNIGVGLLHRPQLVYMDEPTVGVDPQSRRRILDTVLRLRDEYQMAVLYTTHLMEESQELSDRVGIIDHGKLIAVGSVGELTQQVGEEDRLVLNVGEQIVGEELLGRLKSEINGISNVSYANLAVDGAAAQGEINILATRGRKALPDVITLLNDVWIDVSSIEVREPDLEAVFLNLTGHALRD
ncbi:MAG: ABC transporter ATP-binding protein [Chloroflexi bacterium]|nr:ABC transporter ATP-binding protein [Chloroflexota bacterium]